MRGEVEGEREVLLEAIHRFSTIPARCNIFANPESRKAMRRGNEGRKGKRRKEREGGDEVKIG